MLLTQMLSSLVEFERDNSQSNITWSEMGQQTNEAKEVYSVAPQKYFLI